MNDYSDLIKHLRDAAKVSAALAVLLPQSDGNAMVKLLNKAADAIEKLSKPRWIPVTERLPEIRQVVLITDGIDVGTGWMNQGWWNTSFADIRPGEVTHWMPLPQPPKAEEGE